MICQKNSQNRKQKMEPLKPLDFEVKKNLEKKFGYAVCPYTVILSGELRMHVALENGTYLTGGLTGAEFNRKISAFACGVEGFYARGGERFVLLTGDIAYTPCSKEFANKCPLYSEASDLEKNPHNGNKPDRDISDFLLS